MQHIINIPATSVWTRSTTALTHPLTSAIASGGIKRVRVSIEMNKRVGDIEVQAFYQYSNDGKTWDTAVAIGEELDANEVDMGSLGWETITTDAKRFIRFGLLVKNGSTSDLNLAYAGLRIETRSY